MSGVISVIYKNSFYSMVSIVLRLIANVIVFWAVARYYGPEVFGQFSLAHTIATLFILLGDFGLDVLITTEIAQNKQKARQYFQLYFPIKLVLCVLGLIIMWSISVLSNLSPESRQLLYIFSFLTVFTTVTNFTFAVFKGFERLEYETRVSMIANFSLLLLIVVMIYLNAGIFIISFAFIFTRLVALFFGMSFLRNFIDGFSFRMSLESIVKVKSKILVFGTHLLFSYLFFQLDTILIAFLRNETEVGIYQSVIKIVMLPLIIPEILINAMMPVLSRYYISDAAEWIKLSRIMNKILLVSSCVILVFLGIYAEELIIAIYAKESFLTAVPVLQIFAVTLFIRFNGETSALMLTTSNRQNIRMTVVIVASIINIILNFILIPRYGIIAAALVSFITNFVVISVYIYFNSHFLNWLVNARFISFLGVSAFIAFVITESYDKISFYFALPILVISFAAIGYFILFTKEEKELMFSGKIRLVRIKGSD
ncbi:MAG: oligosaccharide flippase family protein [Melioribacteraceae bacterium]|nr:oligosaccharide flippase family protein [Melioribacteraceae bacterium]